MKKFHKILSLLLVLSMCLGMANLTALAADEGVTAGIVESTEGTPIEETPVEEPPAEEPSVEEAPAEETPAEETPAEEPPAEETPAEGTPVEETPAEEPIVEVTVETVVNAIENSIMALNMEPDPEPVDVYVYLKANTGVAGKLGFPLNNNENDNTWSTLGQLVKIQVNGLDDPTNHPNIRNGGEPYYVPGEILSAAINQLDTNAFTVYGPNSTVVKKIDLVNGVDWSADGMGLHTSNGATDYVGSGVNTWHLDGTLKLFTVTYTDGVDGTELFEDQVTKDLLYGDKTPVFQGTPTREGYIFKGWNEFSDTVTGTVTYTAQWAPEPFPVYVYLKADENSEGLGFTLNGNKGDNTWYTLGQLENVQVAGLNAPTTYQQIGGDGGGKAVYIDEPILSAVISQLESDTFEVFDKNSGAVAKINLVNGVDWSTRPMGLHTANAANDYVDETVNTWHLDGTLKRFTVTYKDGADGTVFVDQATKGLLYGAETPAAPSNPTREGYTFKGWDKEIADTVTGDVTYTAVWEKIPEPTTVYVYIRSDKPVDGWTANRDSANGVYWYTVGSVKLPASVLPSAQTYPTVTTSGSYEEVTWADETQQTAAIAALENVIWYNGNQKNIEDVDWVFVKGTNYLGLHTSKAAVDFDVSGNQWHLDGVLKTYTVSYEWEGLPEGAKPLPTDGNKYFKGENVTVDAEYTNGYTYKAEDGTTYKFSGWSTEDATIANNSLTMPGKDVKIVGSWTKTAVPSKPIDPETIQARYLVQWFDQDGNKLQKDAIRGPEKIGTEVAVTDADQVIEGYTFVTGDTRNVLNGTLSKDEVVILKLYFTKNAETPAQYTVTYSWTGLPEGASVELPDGSSHKAGDSVTVDKLAAGDEVTVEGVTYVFSGWSTEDATITDGAFTMPDQDVEIVGTWTAQSTTPTPTTPNYHRLTVHYVYQDGTMASEDYEQGRMRTGDSYRVPSPELEGYTCDIQIVEGTMPNHDVEVTVVYTPVTAPDVELPEEDVPLTELPDEDVPLAEEPERTPEVELVELTDEDVPLAEVPQTGDNSWIWAAITLASACGLIWLTLQKRKTCSDN